MSWLGKSVTRVTECAEQSAKRVEANYERMKQQALEMQLLEKKPLPVGVTEFHEWAERIIGLGGLTATPDSQKFTLANMIINLGPTVAFESDGFFINSLRKAAANQVADAMRCEIRDAAKARMMLDQQNQAKATPPAEADAQLLGDKGVSGA